jgi:hypothetical protein
MLRPAGLALVVAALGGCNPPPFDLDAYVRAHYPGCKGPEVCGDLAYVDCNAAADGPAYYLRKRDGTEISACGGRCMILMERGGADTEQGKVCRTLCTPPAWRCGSR